MNVYAYIYVHAVIKALFPAALSRISTHAKALNNGQKRLEKAGERKY